VVLRSNLALRRPLANKLENKTAKLVMVQSKKTENPMDQIVFRKPVRRHIRDFAGILAIVLLAIAAYITYQGSSLANCGALFFTSALLLLLGYRFPAALHRVWESWMLLAEKLGLAVTFLLLAAVWWLMLVPTAIILRLISKRVMNMNFREPRLSYWEYKNPADSDYKRLVRQY